MRNGKRTLHRADELRNLLSRVGNLREVDSEFILEFNFIVNALANRLTDPGHFRIETERLQRRRRKYRALDGSEIGIWEHYLPGETLRSRISELLEQLGSS